MVEEGGVQSVRRGEGSSWKCDIAHLLQVDNFEKKNLKNTHVHHL